MEQEKKKGRIASASILTWTFIKKKSAGKGKNQVPKLR